MRVALKRAIKRRKLTQAELARRVGVQRAAVSLWLSGDRTPTLATASVVARVLRADAFKLFAVPGGKRAR